MDTSDFKFLKEVDLTDRVVYDFYRQNRREVAKGINQYNYFSKAVEGLLFVLQGMIAESEGGVYIEGLGYFACVKNKSKRKLSNPKSLLDRGKKYQPYFPYFFPDNELSDWTMSETFVLKLRNRIGSNKIQRKLHFDLCQSIRIADDFAKKKNNHRENTNGEFKFIPKI